MPDPLAVLAFLTDPANLNMPVLVLLAVAAWVISVIILAWHLAKPRNRRHSVDRLRNPDHNPAVDGTIDYIRRPQ